MKDNPALASYITSAQKLHGRFLKLQGDLIERRKQQQKQLVETKSCLRSRLRLTSGDAGKDEGLKELNHLLEMRRREVNASAPAAG